MVWQNLEVKTLNDERKATVAAQSAAEATMQRVQASQKSNKVSLLEVILAPVQAEVTVVHQEISKLHDTNRAPEAFMRSKDATLVEVERRIRSADAKAAMVEEIACFLFGLVLHFSLLKNGTSILQDYVATVIKYEIDAFLRFLIFN
uniref:Uncharacterized protein n=1 Tax=Physcomitrium patens TaxID=3218 RepID=A9RMP5_PHYPA|nr:hypothetical protein PHYPA_022661 [Physcomitrium patens]